MFQIVYILKPSAEAEKTSLPEPVNRVPLRVRAIYDCDADDDDELTCVVGEYITITGQPAKIQQFNNNRFLRRRRRRLASWPYRIPASSFRSFAANIRGDT